VTPNARLEVEGDDARMDNRYVESDYTLARGILMMNRMLKDDRVRGHQEKSIFQFKDLSDRMG